MKPLLTPEVQRELCKLIAAGNYAVQAAKQLKISEQDYYGWIRRGMRDSEGIYHDFAMEVLRAEAISEHRALATISKNATSDWKAAGWWLERRFPKRWAMRKAEAAEGDAGDQAEAAAATTTAPLPPWLEAVKDEVDE